MKIMNTKYINVRVTLPFHKVVLYLSLFIVRFIDMMIVGRADAGGDGIVRIIMCEL